MDATVNSANLAVNRATLVPDGTAVMTYEWARQVAEQVVRSTGLFGSIFVPFGFNFSAGQPVGAYIYRLATTVALPIGYYGTTYPPTISVGVQYGSMVIYKSVFDMGRHIRDAGEGNNRLRFQTYVEKLNHDGTQWSFQIVHQVHVDREPGLIYMEQNTLDPQITPFYSDGFIKRPYLDMQYGFWPDVAAMTSDVQGVKLTGVYLHWVAFGPDPNT